MEREIAEEFGDYIENGSSTLENYKNIVYRMEMSTNVGRKSQWEGDEEKAGTADAMKENWWNTVQDFSQNTSIHGLRQIMEPQPFTLRRSFMLYFSLLEFY